MKRSIKIEELVTMEKKIKFDFPNTKAEKRQNSYLKSYNYFVNYFAKSEITEEKLILGASFSYGWMPRGLILNFENITETIQILNTIKIGDIDKNQIESIKKTINNSIVGTSKLLHFINPQKYPIWDSTMNTFFYDTTNANDVCKYIEYKDYCMDIINQDDFTRIHTSLDKKIENTYGYSVSKCRAFELIIFMHVKNK